MSTFQLPPDVLRVGEPTPFALRDRRGHLLAPRGMLVATEDQLRQLVTRDLYIDEQDGELLKRAMEGKLNTMVQRNALIGVIAQTRTHASDIHGTGKAAGLCLDDPPSAWSSLQLRLSALLRDPSQPDFEARLLQLQSNLCLLLDADVDAALLLLVHKTTQEFHEYSVSHALLVAVICELAARHFSAWGPDQCASLRCAALTMNVAMTQLQNQLASQVAPPCALQREQINHHAMRGADSLRAAGVTDALWLGAVEGHHHAPPGALVNLSAAQQLARLIQRADIYAAQLSPRKCRPAMSASAAAKAAYLDENQQPDPAGSAIIKVLGLYPPGSLVRLRNGDAAVVLRRGQRANAPRVASIVNPQGHAIAEPAVRNTELPAFEVASGVAAHQIRVRLNLERLLKMN